MRLLIIFILSFIVLSCSQTRQSNNNEEIYCYDDTIIANRDTLIYTRTNLIDTIAIDTIM